MSDKKKDKKEEPAVEAPAEGVEGTEGAAPVKSKKKKLIIIVGAVVLVGAIVGGLFAGGILGGSKEEEHAKTEEHGKAEGVHPGDDPCLEPASGGGEEKKEEAVDPCKPVYFDMPDLIVNLSTESRRSHFANLKLTLELKNADAVKEVEDNMPRIIDSFNTYLREMTKEDLEGSEGLIRLEDEMMLRLNKILKPGIVKDILFKSVIVQ